MTAIAAGVVSFNPDRNLALLCTELAAQGCAVFVHDNASATGQEVLAECERSGARVVRADQNTGVAGGLADLLAQTATGFEWLLTFDQDSQVPEGYVEALRDSPAAADAQVAIVAPRVIETATGATVQGRADDTGPRALSRVITSGALCRIAALDQVGGFRSDLFIDYVDYDLSLRLTTAGWKLMLHPDAVLQHTIGAQSTHRVVGKLAIITSNHSPDRQYYKFRNYLLLLRDRTLWADPRSAVLDGLALLWAPVKIVLFEQNRQAKLRAIGQGLADGVRGRGGPRPAARSQVVGGR